MDRAEVDGHVEVDKHEWPDYSSENHSRLSLAHSMSEPWVQRARRAAAANNDLNTKCGGI